MAWESLCIPSIWLEVFFLYHTFLLKTHFTHSLNILSEETAGRHSVVLSLITTHISRFQGRKWKNALQLMCQERFTLCARIVSCDSLMGVWWSWGDATPTVCQREEGWSWQEFRVVFSGDYSRTWKHSVQISHVLQDRRAQERIFLLWIHDVQMFTQRDKEGKRPKRGEKIPPGLDQCVLRGCDGWDGGGGLRSLWCHKSGVLWGRPLQLWETFVATITPSQWSAPCLAQCCYCWK